MFQFWSKSGPRVVHLDSGPSGPSGPLLKNVRVCAVHRERLVVHFLDQSGPAN